ncbi:MAG: hypothetical protein ACK55Z_06055, partial [bacterium]
MGSMLYQIRKYDKTPEGKELMLKEMGFEPEDSKAYTFIPGVNPGKSCPVATNFLSNPDALEGTMEKEIIFSEMFYFFRVLACIFIKLSTSNYCTHKINKYSQHYPP